MIVCDGKDMVLGRLASFVAKQLLKGERVVIVNAEKVVISGRRESTLNEYRAWLGARNLTNPRKGPFHLKRPEDLVRLAVRGMLPYDRPRGKEAFRRLQVHAGVPKEFSGKELVSIPDASLDQLGTRRFIRVETLSKHLGGKS